MSSFHYLRLPNPQYIPPLQPYRDGYWKRAKMYGDAQFKRHFRVTKTTFLRLHAALYGDAILRCSSYDSDFRVAVYLWRMATKQTCREMGEHFDIAQSSVSRITNEVAHLVVQKLSPLYIRFPVQLEELFRISREWEQLAGFRHVIGAIDGSHIDLDRAPSEEGSGYFDRKKNYSIQLQAVVDNKGIFRDIDIGWPGSVHDARVFSNSSFCRWMDLFIAQEQKQHPSHVWYVLGDVAYPLTSWMLTPFKIPDLQRGPWTTTFNINHARTRVPVENAFGRLKGRWRRLYCLDTSDIATANTWIHSCAVLHNLCELHSDALEEDVLKRIKHRIELEKALAEEMRENQNDNADNGCDRDEDESMPLITDSEKRDGLAMIMYDEWLKSRK
jgi:hypothetical protein